MPNRPRSPAIAAKRDMRTSLFKQWALGSLIGVGAIWAGSEIFADGHEVITESHGFNEFGELKYGPDFEHLEYVNPNAPLGGEISVATTGTFDSMNPYATLSGTPGALSSSVWETLMTVTSDEVGSVYCLLCETMEYPEDKSWLILNMRDNIRFSDGTEMTAEDVKFTIELLLEQGTPSAAGSIRAMVNDIEVLEDNALKITFNDDAPIRGRFSQMGIFPVMSKAWFEETGARLDEASLEVSPGSGEYMVRSIDVGRSIIYERNPDFWGKDLPINVGRGNYDTIRIEYFADSSAAFEAFKAGDYTFRQESSSINWATAYDFPAIDNGWVVREELSDGTLPGATGFMFNLDREQLADRRVRRAIGLVYNFTWTNENLQYGLFQQRESFWENDRLKAVGLPEGRELEILESLRDKLPEEIFTQDALLPHISGTRPLDRGNLRSALVLMEGAGWSTSDDGLLRDADGNTLDIEFLETRQSFDRIINPYIENLKRLGVNVTYNRVDPSQYQARRQAKDYDMIFGVYTNGLQEGRGFSQRYGCDEKDDIFNPAAYCSEAIDIIGDLLPEADSYDEMAALIRAADRIMRYDYFVVPVWYLGRNWAAYYDFYEYPENLPEFGLGHLDYWWVNQDKYNDLVAAGAFQ
ncbi:microcin C transport system substrate-binding protein [Yoonia maricola]|uniref:Microcin C transport system substrate-binding protein n=1 Tax=Yoonia maricola TaxID=420999 RepID=A0A2M8W2M1_9RHOB|nr:extracellular solute-binding protein [Yoonia maricola]PJI85174.1 microcin C transport system substrate-binding protein [Yoonia maricola]